MDRLTRGFHRLGLVVAVPLALIGVPLFGYGMLYPDPQSAGAWIGLICLIGGTLIYAACRALAWIVNGFRETA